MNPARIRAYLFLTIAVLIWGFAAIVIKVTLNELPPFVFLAYRFLLTSLIMVPIALARKVHLPKTGKGIITLLLVGIFGTTINIGFLFYGLKYTTVADSAIIGATAPLVVIFAGMILFKEHVTKREKIGVIITIIGTLLLTIQPVFETNIGVGSRIFGNVLIVLSNLGWVGYVLLSKNLLKERIDPFLVTTVEFVVGFVTILPLAFLEIHSFSGILTIIVNSSLNAHLGVIYMAIFSGSIAYYLYEKGQKTIEASEAALFIYLQSIFSILFAIIFLNEAITVPFLIGSAVVVFGVVTAEWKKK